MAKLTALKGCICTALFVVGSCVAARAELASPIGETDVVASPAYIDEPLAKAGSWDDDTRHWLLGHEMLDHATGEPLLMAEKATSPSKTQREAEQEIADFIDEALLAARSIADARKRVFPLTEIALVQVEAGDDRGAARSISEALTAARSIGDAFWRAYHLGVTAKVQMEVGDARGAAWSISEALTAAWSITDAGNRVWALSIIAEVQVEAGDRRSAAQSISEALTVARSIKKGWKRDSRLSQIVGAQAKAGDIPGAFATTRSIEEASDRDIALSKIAPAQAKVGDISGALATARRLEKAQLRGYAFAHIAGAQAEAGDIRGALSTAWSIEDAGLRAFVFSGIAEAQVEAGDARGAARSISEALTVARRIADAEGRVRALRSIVGAQVEAGDLGGAAQSISEAFTAAYSIREVDRASSLSVISQAQAKVRDIQGALDTARRIGEPNYRASGLANIARALAERQRRGPQRADGEAEPTTQADTAGTGVSPAPSPKKLQAALAVLGFDPGLVDGKVGPKTTAAIAQWQETVGQEPTGTLDATQQTALVNSAFGEQTDQKEQSSAQETSTSGNTTPSDTFSGGCAERMEKMDSDIGAVSEAMGDYIRRTKNEYGFDGLGACGSSIIGYNVTLNYVEALRRCPESDPTGEQLAAQETNTEQMGAGADMICAGGIDSRQRHSMKDLLDRLTSLTPVPSIYSIVPPNDGLALRHGHHFEPVDFAIDQGRGHHNAYSAGSCLRTYARACGCRQRPRRHREELTESERGWSAREAFVTMMQTADLGQGNGRSGPGRLNGSSIRCVLADRQVGP